MYQGAHDRRNGKKSMLKNKPAVLFLTLVLLIGAVIGTTVAFLITNTEPVENQFTYANVSCEVQEHFDKTTKKDVKVKNTGNTDAYIRATYIVNWLDKDGNIVASVPEGYRYELIENPDQKWTDGTDGTDGYFYYLTPVAPNNVTMGSLLTCTVTYPKDPEYTLSVEILATAIQSTPASAIKEAWGITLPSGN